MPKTNRLFRTLVISLFTVTVLVATGTHSVAAATSGITVSPGQLSFSLSKDAAQQVLPVTITNSYDSAITLSAQFQGIDENAGLLVPTATLDPSFASTLRVSDTSLTLAPQETKTLQVQASNPTTLSPGGHYATLVLTQQGTSGKQLSLNAAISLSIFVVKVEGAQQKLTATDVTTDGWLLRKPTTAHLTFHNEGNVHVVPRAVVSVLDDKYQTLASGVANQQSLPLLPGKSLTSTVAIKGLTSTWKPQKLLLWTAYRADGVTEQTFVKTTMWYIPPFYPIVLLILLLLLVLSRRRWVPALRRGLKKLCTMRASKESVPDTSVASVEPASIAKPEIAQPVTDQSTNEPAPTLPIPESIDELPLEITPPITVKKSKTVKRPAKTTVKKISKKPITKSSKEPAKKAIKVTDEPIDTTPPPLTLASLERRTTKIVPKATAKTATKPKSTAKTTKKPAKKPAKSTTPKPPRPASR